MVILVVFGLMPYHRKASGLVQAIEETLAKLMFVMLTKHRGGSIQKGSAISHLQQPSQPLS